MQETTIQPFAHVLDSILGDDAVSIPLLFRLSDMSLDDADEFSNRWQQTSVERRVLVMQHLADLSEENFEVEYSPIFAIGLQDESPLIRKAALDGLWDTENLALVRPIIALMQTDPNTEVRQAATATLAHFVLMGVWGQIPATVSEQIVSALLEQHTDLEAPLAVRRTALEALGAADHDDIPRLIADAYESHQRDMQISAVFAMGNSADPRWLDTLLDEMESPYEDMRAFAARSAGEIGGSRVVSPLADLVFDSDRDVQLAAIDALGKVGGDRAQRFLHELSEDEEVADLHDAIDDALEEMEWSERSFELGDMLWGEE